MRTKVTSDQVKANEGLIFAVAKRYFPKEPVTDELVQAGRIGLWKALERFDESRGVAFSTYAFPWIRTTIDEELGISRRQKAAQRAEKSGKRSKRIPKKLTVSMDAPLDDSVKTGPVDGTLHDIIGTEATQEVAMMTIERKREIRAAIGRLNAEEQEIITRWMDGETCKEIGESFDRTRQRIQQRIAEIVETLSKYIRKD